MSENKSKTIENFGKMPENLTVMKSRPLLALWKSELSLEEFKILDTYLARIDSNNPDSRLVIFEKGELEKLLGVKKINIADLKRRIHNLCQTIDVSNPLDHKQFHLVSLFEEAIAIQDENDGLWKVKLECTQKAMKYIFNINKIGYLRYKLRYITSLKSRQSYILFQFLEDNRFRNPITVDLTTLKEILNAENEPSYTQFKRFNDRVLKRVHQELNEKTECKFKYEPIKRGRTVVAVKFTLEENEKLDYSKEEVFVESGVDGIDEWEKFKSLSDYDKCIFDCCRCCENVFSEDEMRQLVAMTNNLPLDNMCSLPFETDDIGLYRYEYIKEKWISLKAANSRKEIKNKFSYLKTMIENDIKRYK